MQNIEYEIYCQLNDVNSNLLEINKQLGAIAFSLAKLSNPLITVPEPKSFLGGSALLEGK